MKFVKADKNFIDDALKIRLNMLPEVNGLDKIEYDNDFIEITRDFFLNENQTTVLAYDGADVVGCASICYISLMPTFSHPYGLRGHIMNVYTDKAYRRKGVALTMVKMLLDEAVQKNVTSISLDATTAGRPLYEKLGFKVSDEAMEIIL